MRAQGMIEFYISAFGTAVLSSEAVGQQGPQVWDLSVNFSWSEEAEKAIASSHYRHMRSLAASDPMRLTPGCCAGPTDAPERSGNSDRLLLYA